MARIVSERSCWFLASTETIKTGRKPLSRVSICSWTNQISPRLGSRFEGMATLFGFPLQLCKGELAPSRLLSDLFFGKAAVVF